MSYKKYVVSREELLDISEFDLVELYKKLLSSYKNAFVYVWFHPMVGLWLGATPETLLNIEGTSFKNNVFSRNTSRCSKQTSNLEV